MDDDDKRLWDRFTRDIEPLEKDMPLPQERKCTDGALDDRLELTGSPKKGAHFVRGREIRSRDRGAVPSRQGVELDGRTAERLKSGRLPIEARLDLHGMSQEQAHRALNFFIQEAYGQRKRTVLVITGKGRHGPAPQHWTDPESGVLARRVPEWLRQSPLRGVVLQSAPAQPKHGGSGALYVYLRRDRG